MLTSKKLYNLGGECECRSLRGVNLITVLEIIDSNYRTDIIKGSKNTCIHWNMNNNKKTLVFLFINTHIYFLLAITNDNISEMNNN